MSGSNRSKIERVSAPGNPAVWVDLFLDKRSGYFFSRVGRESISEKTKEAAVKKIMEALTKLENVEWRQLIVVTVRRSRDGGGTRNGIKQHLASCTISYERVERAPNPIRKGERIERLHPLDFASKRQDRTALADSHGVWEHNSKIETEYEIPYSDEAWTGIERIAETLRATQKRLDDFASKWTTETLAALGTGEPAAALLLPATEPKQRTHEDGTPLGHDNFRKRRS